MAREIAEHHVLQFTKNVELSLQQKTPRFSGATTEAHYEGKAAQVVLQFGQTEMQNLPQSQWKDPTQWSDVEHHQRWVLPGDFAVSLPLTRQDQIRMIADPRSPYVESIRAAYARKCDDLVIAAAVGDAKIGPYESMTDTPLPAGQIIADSAAGLNLAKLLHAKEILDSAENDPQEERFVVVTARQVSELLNTTEIKSADYNTVKALAQGAIDTFLGFKFIRSERLAVNAGIRQCFAWVKSGLHLGMWEGLTVKMDERTDRNYVWQVYARATLGATRTDEGKVVRIDCLES